MWGNDPIWQAYFSKGLVQPPTTNYCWWLKSCTTWDVWNPINNGSKEPLKLKQEGHVGVVWTVSVRFSNNYQTTLDTQQLSSKITTLDVLLFFSLCLVSPQKTHTFLWFQRHKLWKQLQNSQLIFEFGQGLDGMNMGVAAKSGFLRREGCWDWWKKKHVPSLKLAANAPENRPGPKRKFIFQPSIFRCYVTFREGNLLFWLRAILVDRISIEMFLNDHHPRKIVGRWKKISFSPHTDQENNIEI